MSADQARDEWIYVARIIMRWPRLGVCDARTAQSLVAGINDRLYELSMQADSIRDVDQD